MWSSAFGDRSPSPPGPLPPTDHPPARRHWVKETEGKGGREGKETVVSAASRSGEKAQPRGDEDPLHANRQGPSRARSQRRGPVCVTDTGR